MAIIILPVCFIAIFLSIGVLLSTNTGKKEILIFSVLTFSVLVVAINEVLGAFSAINYTSIFIAWDIIALLNVIYLYNKKTTVAIFIDELRQRLAQISLTRIEKFSLYFTAGSLVLVFAQGVIYPPNNYDSMTYHLSRVASWVSQGSVEHFRTNIFYQVYQPPFAEYVVMHFNLLAHGDYFASTVQFCYLLFALVVLIAIIKKLGLPRRYQVWGIVFAALIPEVLLQASSTQNNIVEAFFVLTAYYLSLQAIDQPKLKYYLFLGIAVGLALLTKATTYIYLFPVLLVFGVHVLVRLFKTKNYRYLWYPLIVIVIGLAINARQYQRNYAFSKSVLGTPKQEVGSYTNRKMGPMLLLSNLVKNAGLQVNMIGINRQAIFADTVIHKLHRLAGVPIDGFDNNFAVAKYAVPTSAANHEDSASNPFHFILLIIAFVLVAAKVLRERQFGQMAQLLFMVLLQALLFCWFLKWQPWNTRLHVQFFLLSIPLFCYAVSGSKWFGKMAMAVMPVIMLYAIVVILHNASRPYLLLSKEKPYISTWMFDGRYKNYFTNRPLMYPEYNKVNTAIQNANYKNIGLIVGYNDWEYPLFTNCYSRELYPVHLFIGNATKNIASRITTVDCIVSTNTNKPFVDYNGKRFYNKNTGNKYIYLYE